MYQLIDLLQQWYVGEALIALAVALFLVDYFFPTDWPAHLGYFCFALGMFFIVPWGLLLSVLAAIALWIALAVLHQVWFRKFLTNATQARYVAEGPPEEAKPA